MIDLHFITRYTTGLYSTSLVSAPRYDEFRDMFSSGQLRSKEWLVNEIKNLQAINQDMSVIIVGAWYGTLGFMLNTQYPDVKINMIDIDPRCAHFIKNISRDIANINANIADMYEYNYTEDIVINTSCEHIHDVNSWLSKIPAGKIVALQSNNFVQGSDHVNCVGSLQEFAAQCDLAQILYSGQLDLSVYTRYMIIGKT